MANVLGSKSPLTRLGSHRAELFLALQRTQRTSTFWGRIQFDCEITEITSVLTSNTLRATNQIKETHGELSPF